MPLYRLSAIFQLSSQPTATSPSPIRTGGWSESVWATGALGDIIGDYIQLLRSRAAFLPSSAKIVAYRTQLYTISRNKLLPGGSATTAVSIAPGSGRLTDVPQMALRLAMTTNAGPMKSSYTCRGFPDDYVVGGEFAGGNPITQQLNAFGTSLQKIWFGWVGRDLNQVPFQIVSYNNGTLVTSAPITGVGNGDYIRFFRAKLDGGSSLNGAFVVNGAPVGSTYVLQGAPAGSITTPRGLVRKDVLVYSKYDGTQIDAVFVRKVGRPIKGYRGRRSRKAK